MKLRPLVLVLLALPTMTLAVEAPVVDRLLARTSLLAPDANADAIIDVGDVLAVRSLPSSAVTFRLVGPPLEVYDDGTFEVAVFIDSPGDALGSYRVVISYPSDALTLVDVEDGGNPIIGSPTGILNEPEWNRVAIESRQAASLDEPTGSVEVARLVFQPSQIGQFLVTFLDAGAFDVAEFRRPVRSVAPSSITVGATPPPLE
jgi:hypothetical protein